MYKTDFEADPDMSPRAQQPDDTPESLSNSRQFMEPLTNGSLISSHAPQALSILVHSHLRWDFVWQRPQQIFSRLAASHTVLFTEEPMWTEGEGRLEITEPYPNVVRIVPLLSPRHAASVDSQCEAILPLLHAALARHPLLAGRFTSLVQWFYSPMTAPCFMGHFKAAATIYDCMDELSQFRFAPPDIKERERLLLSRADVVFTGGYHLFESKSRYHPNVHFYGCGVDTGHFGKARCAGTPVPPELAHLPKPILGYFGVIDERLDYQLLEQLAGCLPEASVVMVGPVAKVEPETLPQAPNIHWLGQRDYAALPGIVKAFDVCLMPFALNEATQYINPTKTYEYMAAGKPVVSSAVPDVVRNFTPIVRIAHSHGDFVRAVNEALKEPRSDLIEQGLKRAAAASWDGIVGAMRGHILESVRAAREAAVALQRGFP